MLFQECVRSFVKDSGNKDVLVMHVQDPFHRLLLHGVCEVFSPTVFLRLRGLIPLLCGFQWITKAHILVCEHDISTNYLKPNKIESLV